jgi:hypothetical protein
LKDPSQPTVPLNSERVFCKKEAGGYAVLAYSWDAFVNVDAGFFEDTSG